MCELAYLLKSFLVFFSNFKILKYNYECWVYFSRNVELLASELKYFYGLISSNVESTRLQTERKMKEQVAGSTLAH